MKFFLKKIFFISFLALIAFTANAKTDTTTVSLETYKQLTVNLKAAKHFLLILI